MEYYLGEKVYTKENRFDNVPATIIKISDTIGYGVMYDVMYDVRNHRERFDPIHLPYAIHTLHEEWILHRIDILEPRTHIKKLEL